MTRNGFVLLGMVLMFTSSAALACIPATNAAVQAGLSKDLAKYPGVTVRVDDCVAELSGTVNRYPDKQAAEHKAHSYGALTRVMNQIAVDGVTVPDQELVKKLKTGLAYDNSEYCGRFNGYLARVEMCNTFDWFTVNVDHGAVTLRGYAHSPMTHESAVGLIANTKGVKDLIDQTETLPVSLIDDQIRLAAARRIYTGVSFPGAMDPEHPIRIIVENGNVKLEGVVLTQLDKTRAGMIVSGMGNVFSVQNDLQIKKG